ncbi:MAG TPA: hypothetical protein VKH37_08985, partial [Ferruginibacter sp.]|nr:hypothetical protein [Ferruginibacter sp.]
NNDYNRDQYNRYDNDSRGWNNNRYERSNRYKKMKRFYERRERERSYECEQPRNSCNQYNGRY